LVDALQCGILDDTDQGSYGGGGNNGDQRQRRPSHRRSNSHTHKKNDPVSNFLARTDEICNMSPTGSDVKGGFGVGVGDLGGVGGEGTSGTAGGNGWNTHSDFNDEYEEFGVSPRNSAVAMTDENNKQMSSKEDQDGSKKNTPGPISTDEANDHTISSSTLFAKALVNEVTDNPKTMTPQAMAEREKKLLKAQEKARQVKKSGGARPVGAPGVGVGKPNVLSSIAHALRVNASAIGDAATPTSVHNRSIVPPNSLSENRAVAQAASSGSSSSSAIAPLGKYTVTIGLSLSRRSSKGHPDTVTRQTAFDFNELQDREYKYVSSTESSGWRAGGGERGGVGGASSSLGGGDLMQQHNQSSSSSPGTPINHAQESHKVAAPDTVHIPIIHIDAGSPQNVDVIISALARGEVFIPHMAIIPESLSVNGVSPPDLVVRFGTERNEDLPPDEWPNWCIEFMHNQLYEYFHGMGARWMKRPFSITLARKVRWKTVKHMNRYFAHAERTIDAWREKGPQYLDPQLAYIEGGATPEEVARPHGIYLFRNGVPTNYFAPNFDPPYTTKMTRSLLLNVLGKSWDKRRREWSSEPIPRLVTPSMLVSAMFGCNESQAGGFVATEATTRQSYIENSDGIAETTLPGESFIRTYDQDALVAATRNDKSQQQNQDDDHQHFSDQLQQQHPDNDDYNVEGIESSNASPTAIDLRALSSASGVPSPTHLQHSPQNEYVEDRMMAKVEEFRTHQDRQQVSTSSPMRVRNDMNIQLASSSIDESDAMPSAYASKSAISAASPHSSKYGRPPTPENLLSPMRSSDPADDQELENLQSDFRNQHITDDQENANPAEKTKGPVDPPEELKTTSAPANSDIVQSSVVGTTTTILHMNLSAEKYITRESERKMTSENIDEKREEGVACDEDWLDEVVSFE
jgi:hypothetical protein